jgi:hypothetical protein
VVYGHLHQRATHMRDGVRFEEVSLGYPPDWDQAQGLQGYLREVLPGRMGHALSRPDVGGVIQVMPQPW